MKLSSLFVLSTVVFCSAASVHAQTVSPVPTPTIITTAPITINTPGYYQLGANLTVSATSGSIITINASNVTLDFAGHYISGPSDATSVATGTLIGVASVEQGNLIIQNGTIAFCAIGIEFYGNSSASSINVNQTAKNMLITYCSEWGIYLASANYSRVTDSVISNISGFTGNNPYNVIAGVLMATGSGNNVSRNSIINISSSNGFGINNRLSANCLAQHNQLLNCNTGISNVTKYEDNLTAGCATPFIGGTGVGTND